MIDGQKQRFQENNYLDVIQKYLEDPAANESAYLQMLDN